MARSLPYPDMEKILSLSKRRGFVFQSSEIYGGLASTWDYGPLGVELKRHVKEAWWRSVILERDDVVGLDAAILMNPKVWETSGHVENFADPLAECNRCHHRFRADQVWDAIRESDWWQAMSEALRNGADSTSILTQGRRFAPNLGQFIEVGVILDTQGTDANDRLKVLRIWAESRCPDCGGELTEPRNFNLMFRTHMGPLEDTAHEVFLRPETAQGIFVNFANVLNTTRKKLPFGIGQIGKSFRNEIAPGNFTFRTREFEQMEMEFFVKPGTDEEWLHKWVQERFDWYVAYGIRRDNLRLRRHDPDELAHYAQECYDIEYRFPWGWAELEGIADRTDYDLRQHAAASGQDLTYFEADDSGSQSGATAENSRYFPFVIEPAAGVDRATLAFWLDSYDEEPDASASSGQAGETVRVVLHLHRALAPITVAILPLSRNARLAPKAREVYALVRRHFTSQFDDAQSIGRRYRRQDEIGTPYCVTVDFDTLEDHRVTIRDRDTMHQSRIAIADLVPVLQDKLEHGW